MASVMSDLYSLTGKHVLVTGGTRGIGRAVSLQFARAGAVVIANYVRDQKASESLLQQAQMEGIGISVCRADLTNSKGMNAIVEAVHTSSDELHGLIHCAATGVHKAFEDLTMRQYDWTFSLNVRSFFEIVKRLLPQFASESSIVAVSSQGATHAVPAYSVVGSSKGALEALSRHLAVELAPRGIRVNILSPGTIKTKAWDAMPDRERRLEEAAQRTPMGRLASVDEVAQVAQFLCSDAARAIVGQTLVVDGGTGLLV